jgi:hypothetical protein
LQEIEKGNAGEWKRKGKKGNERRGTKEMKEGSKEEGGMGVPCSRSGASGPV